MSQAIIDQAFVIVKLRKWGVAWKQIAESAKTESARLRQTVDALSQKLNNSEAESRAYFEELEEARRNACLPGEALNDAITRTDRELDTAREQRDSIQVERDALRAEVADLRGIFDMVHASLGIKRGDHIGNAIAALKSQSTPTTKQHPVNGGEWVRKTTDGLMYKIGDTFRLESYEIKDGQIWCNLDNGASWLMSVCEPCDPPEASHATPAGKEAAEAVIRDSQVTEIKVGDVVEVVSATHKIYTEPEDIGRRGVVTAIDGMRISVEAVPCYELPIRGIVGKCDVRKVPQ